MPPQISDRVGVGASGALWLRALLLCLAVTLCYANSLHVPFLLDDPFVAQDQPGIRLDYSTRPLVWASFDLNRALTGRETWSFHVFNALVHLACGFLLLGVLRRSMAHVAPRLPSRTRENLAFVTTILWLCHPLQTAAVTYLSQRAESMGALCYLMVLYGFIRSASAARPLGWQALALLALALGFATKETITTAPLILLLYDALFLTSGPLTSLRQRWGFYAGAALVTLVLGFAFVAPPLLGGNVTMGLGFQEFGTLEYARTQPGVVLHYLRLAFWPHPLCFDYGWPIARDAGDYLPQTALVAALFLVSAVLLVRRSWLGFVGLFFFLFLLPTSSLVPIRDPAFEHRVYLPLAAVVLFVVVGTWWLWARFLPRARALPSVLATTVALALAAMTVRRNEDYRTAERLWRLTLEQAPQNARAHANLGVALLDAGRTEEAIRELTTGMGLDPRDALIQLNLGAAYWQLGKPERAIYFIERSVRLNVTPRGLGSLGHALSQTGDFLGAAFYFQKAVELTPNDPSVHYQLANVLGTLRRSEEALQHFQEALRLDPGFQGAHIHLASVLAEMERPSEALEHLRAALEILPNSAQEYFDLGQVLRSLGSLDEALAAFREASRLAPEMPAACAAFAETVCSNPSASSDERQEALRLASKAIEMTSSKQAEFLEVGAQAQAALGDFERAAALLEAALELPDSTANPDFASRLRAQREDYRRRAGE